jgi:hypothetical protein
MTPPTREEVKVKTMNIPTITMRAFFDLPKWIAAPIAPSAENHSNKVSTTDTLTVPNVNTLNNP